MLLERMLFSREYSRGDSIQVEDDYFCPFRLCLDVAEALLNPIESRTSHIYPSIEGS